MKRILIISVIFVVSIMSFAFSDESEPQKVVRSYRSKQTQLSIQSLKKNLEVSVYSELFSPKAIKRERKEIQAMIDHYNSSDTPKIIIESVDYPDKLSAVVVTSEHNSAASPKILKYLLVKFVDRWLIDDILEICFLCKGTGKFLETECKSCYGTGWRDAFW